MAFVTLEDLHGFVEVILFASVYAKGSEFINADVPILVDGCISKDEKSVKILAESVIPLSKAVELCATAVNFNIDIMGLDKDQLKEFRAILDNYKGECPAFINLRISQKSETVIALPDSLKVQPGRALSEAVDRYFGREVVEIVFQEKNGLRN